jgi:hypothetical protein
MDQSSLTPRTVSPYNTMPFHGIVSPLVISAYECEAPNDNSGLVLEVASTCHSTDTSNSKNKLSSQFPNLDKIHGGNPSASELDSINSQNYHQTPADEPNWYDDVLRGSFENTNFCTPTCELDGLPFEGLLSRADDICIPQQTVLFPHHPISASCSTSTMNIFVAPVFANIRYRDKVAFLVAMTREKRGRQMPRDAHEDTKRMRQLFNSDSLPFIWEGATSVRADQPANARLIQFLRTIISRPKLTMHLSKALESIRDRKGYLHLGSEFATELLTVTSSSRADRDLLASKTLDIVQLASTIATSQIKDAIATGMVKQLHVCMERGLFEDNPSIYENTFFVIRALSILFAKDEMSCSKNGFRVSIGDFINECQLTNYSGGHRYNMLYIRLLAV